MTLVFIDCVFTWMFPNSNTILFHYLSMCNYPAYAPEMQPIEIND